MNEHLTDRVTVTTKGGTGTPHQVKHSGSRAMGAPQASLLLPLLLLLLVTTGGHGFQQTTGWQQAPPLQPMRTRLAAQPSAASTLVSRSRLAVTVSKSQPRGAGFRVRQALIPADLPALSQCRLTAVPPGQEVRRSSLQAFIDAESLSSGRADYGVVAHDIRGQIIGCADVFLSGPGSRREAEVRNVFVRPEDRRKGVARALMQEAIVLAKARGVGTMRLEVDMANRAAVKLYLNLGFSPAGVANQLSFFVSELLRVNLRVALATRLRKSS